MERKEDGRKSERKVNKEEKRKILQCVTLVHQIRKKKYSGEQKCIPSTHSDVIQLALHSRIKGKKNMIPGTERHMSLKNKSLLTKSTQ